MANEKNDKSLFSIGLSALLMFIIGFAGFSIIGVILLIVLISLGLLPAI